MMTHEERDELIAILDSRYVQINQCDPQMDELRSRVADTDKRLAVIEFQIKVNNWLTAAIASGIIALVIKVFLGG